MKLEMLKNKDLKLPFKVGDFFKVTDDNSIFYYGGIFRIDEIVDCAASAVGWAIKCKMDRRIMACNNNLMVKYTYINMGGREEAFKYNRCLKDMVFYLKGGSLEKVLYGNGGSSL